MKTAKLLSYSLLTLLMLGVATLMSCSKDDDIQPEETFDINNPEGYFLYLKGTDSDGSNTLFELWEFMPGKTVRTYHVDGEGTSIPYTILDNNTIGIAGLQFVFNAGLVTSNYSRIKEIVLIKAPESNQLNRKTFAGTYYKADKSVLHQNFFYRFADEGNTVDAGFNVGTSDRTEDYTSIGNIAARAELANGDKELMILVNGKLAVSYSAVGVTGKHYGTFTQQ